MKRLLTSTAITVAVLSGGAAHAACGDVTLAAFSWQSSEAMTYVDQFILSNGYDCNVEVVAGDTVPTITSLIEKGQPDVISEATPSLLGDVYTNGAAEGRVSQIGTAISDGQVSGWYIPQYVADAHPEIKSVADAVAHPELFPAPEDASKGGVIQGPQGWGDTVVTAQLYKALDLDNHGFALVPSGSAAALDGAIAKAYEQQQGFIAAYWAPTSLLVKYPMVRLTGEHDAVEWARCTSVQDCPDPKVNYWKEAEMVTLAAADFTKEADPTVMTYFGSRSWTQAEVSAVMAWMSENQANGEDGAKWFLENMSDVWTKWVPADVAEKVKSAL